VSAIWNANLYDEGMTKEDREDILDVAKKTAHLKALRFQASLLREVLKNPFQPMNYEGLPTVGPMLTMSSSTVGTTIGATSSQCRRSCDGIRPAIAVAVDASSRERVKN
jgi:hypothetical protein